jgi:triosephosphate isomerase
MLEDLGCRYALVGHSERRQLFGETDRIVAAKVRRLLASRVDPILCVGETLEERESEATLEVVNRQLAAVLDLLDAPAGAAAGDPAGVPDEDSAQGSLADGIRRRLVVAYEPVWAIGTGRTATPEIAQAVHASIRERLVAGIGESGQATRILYGGSVKPSNARELLERPDIDGALVGGASLEPETFAEIVISALPSIIPAE